MTFIARSNRYNYVTVADNGNVLVIGTPGTPTMTALWSIQFNPSLDFVGLFYIMGHVRGLPLQPGALTKTPYMTIPYRRVAVNGVASDYAMVADAIVGAGIIQVPANGLSVAVSVVCSAGTCDISSYDVQGAGAP